MNNFPIGMGRGQIVQEILRNYNRESRFGRINCTIWQNGDMGDRRVEREQLQGGGRGRVIPEEERLRRLRQWYASSNNPRGIVNIPNGLDLYPVKILITGHSFVTRIGAALSAQTTTWNTWSDTLALPNDEYDVTIEGLSGATVGNMDLELREIVRRERPTIIIVDIGTNDLKGPKRPGKVAYDAFCAALRWLREVRSIQSIIFCHAIYRMDFTGRHKNLTGFNDDVERFNRQLVRYSKRHSRVHHMKHSGLRRPTWALLEDGLHPGNLVDPWAIGYWRYQRSIRRMCIFGRTQLM
jgi:lysophospholipase L1-like esterase